MKHQTLIGGLNFTGERRSDVLAPTIVKYLGPDFTGSFLDDLKREAWLERLAAAADVEIRDELPILDQHVHGSFHMVVVDSCCIMPGFPRVDLKKIESAGLVVRRETDGTAEGWFRSREGIALGWQGLPTGVNLPNTAFEPDGARRRAKLEGKNGALLSRLDTIAGDEGGISEEVHPLFPIPEEIAKKIGRSLYFGVIPVSSLQEVPADDPQPPFARKDVAARVPQLLRNDRDPGALPPVGDTISRSEARKPDTSGDPVGVTNLMAALTWLSQENGLFTGEPYAQPLRDALGGLAVAGVDQDTLLDWLDHAFKVLVERSVEETVVATPNSWPSISDDLFDALVDGAEGAMTARWSSLAPTITRFGAASDTYHLRCFLRIDDCPGCPPRTVWSPLSTSYRIRPWHESGARPPMQIELPALSIEAMKNLSPTVAFKVPPEIQQFMDKLNLNDLLDGEAKKSSLSFGMICGFNLPIITICAFIILQIFLSLLNIIFFWLPYIRICIPFPVIEEEGGG